MTPSRKGNKKRRPLHMARKNHPKHRKNIPPHKTSYQPKKKQQKPSTYGGPQTEYEYGF